jgi:apolipoprotein N-acyltransferase
MRSGWYQGRDERSAEVALDKHSDDGKMTQVGTQLALSQTIYLNQYITIYNRLGDGKILAILLLSMLFLSWFNRKQEQV